MAVECYHVPLGRVGSFGFISFLMPFLFFSCLSKEIGLKSKVSGALLTLASLWHLLTAKV